MEDVIIFTEKELDDMLNHNGIVCVSTNVCGPVICMSEKRWGRYRKGDNEKGE